MPDTILIEENTRESIRALMASGNFATEQEVIAQGLRLLEEQEKRCEGIDTALKRSISDVSAGLIKPAEEVFDRLETKYAAMLK